MSRSLLLLLLGFCPSVCSHDGRSGTGTHGVLQLDRGTFDEALRDHQQLLVHFCELPPPGPEGGGVDGGGDGCVSLCADAPLSGQGHQVSAAFEGAASELQGSEVKPAVVDVAKDKELAKELNVTGLSEIRLYVSGDKRRPLLCPGTWK